MIPFLLSRVLSLGVNITILGQGEPLYTTHLHLCPSKWYFICPRNVLSTFPSFQAPLVTSPPFKTSSRNQPSMKLFFTNACHPAIITIIHHSIQAGRDHFSSFSLLKTSISFMAVTLFTVWSKVLAIIVCLFIFVEASASPLDQTAISLVFY